jgi:hypothetical protein
MPYSSRKLINTVELHAYTDDKRVDVPPVAPASVSVLMEERSVNVWNVKATLSANTEGNVHNVKNATGAHYVTMAGPKAAANSAVERD